MIGALKTQITKTELMEEIARHVSVFGTRRELAKRLGVSGPYLSDVLNGKREPGWKLLSALGYRRVLVFERVRFGADDGSAR